MIQITQNLISEEFKDFNFWYSVSNFGRVYSKFSKRFLKPCKDKNGYLLVSFWSNNKGKSYHVHRLIAELFIPNPNNYDTVDHIDRNILNNSISNLRWVNKSSNGINGKISKNNTSGYNGVSWDKSRNKWMAHIKINFKFKNLGYFSNINDAVKARKTAEEKYFPGVKY